MGTKDLLRRLTLLEEAQCGMVNRIMALLSRDQAWAWGSCDCYKMAMTSLPLSQLTQCQLPQVLCGHCESGGWSRSRGLTCRQPELTIACTHLRFFCLFVCFLFALAGAMGKLTDLEVAL